MQTSSPDQSHDSPQTCGVTVQLALIHLQERVKNRTLILQVTDKRYVESQARIISHNQWLLLRVASEHRSQFSPSAYRHDYNEGTFTRSLRLVISMKSGWKN